MASSNSATNGGKGKGSSRWMFIMVLAAVVAVVSHQVYQKLAPPPTRPFTPQPHYVLKDIWSPEALDRLEKLVQKQVYRAATDDVTSKYQHVGESRPRNPDGKCPHPFLVPNNKNRSECVFPARLDVGKHYLLTGGFEGHREYYETILSRTLPFQSFIFGHFDDPDMQDLFGSETYKEASEKACNGKTVMDPIQLGIIVAIPGQEVPMHFDVPWFYGATRFQLPQWLLVAMEQSGLFADRRVHQVQGVAYVHPWDVDLNQTSRGRGGEFFFYPKGTDKEILSVPPKRNTGIVLDGSIVLHGTRDFMPGTVPPKLSKDDELVLAPIGNHRMELRINSKPTRQYSMDDLRISLVWRARCFENKDELNKWKSFANHLTPDEVVDILMDDLIKRERIKEAPKDPFDKALLIVDEYIYMPSSPARSFRYNYCVAAKVLPFLKPIMNFFCY